MLDIDGDDVMDRHVSDGVGAGICAARRADGLLIL
jgi:hypothetical protein